MPAARHWYMTCLLGLTLACAVAGIGMAQTSTAGPAPEGLLWNRSGLPAVFPLQVKTKAGQDYLLTLVDAQTGQSALTAYIKGGVFFRVLVPPGRYHLRFATGKTWLGEAQLFGPGDDTTHFEIDGPLRFDIRGHGIKAGHLVDLTGNQAASAEANPAVRIKVLQICQSLRLASDTGSKRPDHAAPFAAGLLGAAPRPAGPGIGTGTLPYGLSDLETWPYGTGLERYPRDPFAAPGAGRKRRLMLPDYEVRAHYC